jgi:hypothetical protein
MCLTRLGLHLARRWVGVVERAERKDWLLTIIPAVAGQYAHAILPLQDQLHGKNLQCHHYAPYVFRPCVVVWVTPALSSRL